MEIEERTQLKIQQSIGALVIERASLLSHIEALREELEKLRGNA